MRGRRVQRSNLDGSSNNPLQMIHKIPSSYHGLTALQLVNLTPPQRLDIVNSYIRGRNGKLKYSIK